MFYKKITLSEAEKAKIKSSVEDLESASSGEIVLYLAQQSDNYSDAFWYLSSLMSFFTAGTFACLSYLWMLPEGITVFECSLFVLLAGFLGFLVPFLFPRLRVRLMNNNSVSQRVFTKAHDVFLQQGVHNTLDGTGILFFISSLEHKVVVIGDSGINHKVSAENWDEVVKHIVGGIKSNNLSDGIVQAIGDCKKLLLDNGFVVRADDTNELKDGIIIED